MKNQPNIFISTFILLFIAQNKIQANDTYLIVTSPVLENQPLYIKVRLANFGHQPFGHKVNGKLELALDLPDWQETDQIDEKLKYERNISMIEANITACSHVRLYNEKYYQEYQRPILLAEAGSCNFLKKSILSENSHAKMLIISRQHLIQKENRPHPHPNVINDDLSGHELNIPVLIIEKEDGDKLKKYVQDYTQVWVSVQFNKPQDQGIADIQYWMLPSDKKSTQWILKNKRFFEKIVQTSQAKFSPHFVFYQYCDKTCQQAYDATTIPQNITSQCLSFGRYCHLDPDGNGPLQGKDSVLQALDELCVAKSIPQSYFQYSLYYFTCYNSISPNVAAHGACHDQAILYSQGIVQNKINKLQQQVEQCVHDSWYKKYPNILIDDNKLLREEYELFNVQGIRFYPQLFVNGEPFRGDLKQLQSVQEFICYALHKPLEIEECAKILNQGQNENLDGSEHWEYVQSRSKYNDLIIYFVISCFALVIFMVGLFFYRRNLKQEFQNQLNLQVNSAISQYYTLQEQKQ